LGWFRLYTEHYWFVVALVFIGTAFYQAFAVILGHALFVVYLPSLRADAIAILTSTSHVEIVLAAIGFDAKTIATIVYENSSLSGLQFPFYLDTVVDGTLGLGAIFIMSVIMFCGFALVLGREIRYKHLHARYSKELSQLTGVIASQVKVWTYSVTDVVGIPLALGVLVDLAALKAFSTDMGKRMQQWGTMPFVFTLGHWFLGYVFGSYVDSIVVAIKAVAVRWGRPLEELPAREEPDFVVNRLSLSTIVQRQLTSICVYAMSVLVLLLLPLRYGHLVCPLATSPLVFQYGVDTILEIQLPLEMLLFHFIAPLVLERVDHTKIVRAFVRAYFTVAGAFLRLGPLPRRRINVPPMIMWLVNGGILEEVEDQPHGEVAEANEEEEVEEAAAEAAVVEVVFAVDEEGREIDDHDDDHDDVDNHREDVPANAAAAADDDDAAAAEVLWRASGVAMLLSQSVRECLLVFGALCYAAVASSLVIHTPLAVGRALLSQVHVGLHHDLYAFSLGILVVTGVSKLSFQAVKQFTRGVRYSQMWWSVVGALVWGVKMAMLSVVWLGVLPLMAGHLCDAVIIIPFRTPSAETARYPVVQSWALGLILFHLWTRCQYMGVFGRDSVWRTKFRHVVRQGLLHVDVMYVASEIFAPLFLWLGDCLFIPYFFARAATLFMPSYFVRTFVMRACYMMYFIVYVTYMSTWELLGVLVDWCDTLRGNRNLLGVEPTNRIDVRGDA
jgi:hypothetical protein